MTLQELRRSGRDGVYDPVTDQYYFVGEEPKAKAGDGKSIATVAALVGDKKTEAVQDVKPPKKTDEKGGK